MLRSYVCTMLIILLTGCSEKEISEDVQHLNMYFTEKHGVNLSEYKDYVVLVVSGNCGSCTEKTIKFINRMGEEENEKFKRIKKIVILPDNNASVLDSMHNNKSIQFIVDKGFELQKYGINFAKNTFFEFRNGNLIYQDVLYLENIDKIAKKYNLAL